MAGLPGDGLEMPTSSGFGLGRAFPRLGGPLIAMPVVASLEDDEPEFEFWS